MVTKNIAQITVEDIKKHPVWRFVNKPNGTEMSVQPVKRLPCTTLVGRLVGATVILADETRAWALLGNIDAFNARLTEHFLTISIEHHKEWFHLARYHDFDYVERGPASLAKFLAKDIDDIFPIKYDLRPYATGEEGSLCGEIPKEPRERLSRAEVIALAVP